MRGTDSDSCPRRGRRRRSDAGRPNSIQPIAVWYSQPLAHWRPTCIQVSGPAAGSLPGRNRKLCRTSGADDGDCQRVRELQAQAVCGAGPPSHLQRLHDGKQLRRSLRGGSGRERRTVQANVIRYDSPARGRMRSVLLPGLSSVAAGRRSAATSHRTRCHRYCCDSNSPVGSTGGVDLITCAEAPGQVRAFRAPTGSRVGAPKFAL